MKKIKTIDFFNIPHKVHSKDFATLESPYPKILGGNNLDQLITALKQAKDKCKPIVWALGGYTTKCGLNPLILDLVKKGYVTHIIMNGAAAIHDVEIALFGETSEWVENGLQSGKFGFSEQTGDFFYNAISYNYKGIGESLRDNLRNGWTNIKCKDSLIYTFDGPILCFSAPGTETIYQHPSFLENGQIWATVGYHTQNDFRRLIEIIPCLENGGVYINVCSAVVLPEIFMKAFSVTANIGQAPKPKTWTAVNLDKRQQYRCTENVLRRPGGNPIQILGEIEITIPVIYENIL